MGRYQSLGFPRIGICQQLGNLTRRSRLTVAFLICPVYVCQLTIPFEGIYCDVLLGVLLRLFDDDEEFLPRIIFKDVSLDGWASVVGVHVMLWYRDRLKRTVAWSVGVPTRILGQR